MSDKLRSRVMVSTQGRITIPEEICKRLGIRKETVLELEVYGKGKLLITVLTK